jgi:uncharacterized protein (DUF1800 family)
MRTTPLIRAAAACALALAAGGAAALSVDEARHLLTRTGFGAAPHEIRAVLPLSRAQAVDRLLAGLDRTPPLAPPPAFVHLPVGAEFAQRLGSEYVPGATAMDPAAVEVLTHRGMQEMEQLRVWWLDRMVSTPTPFAERLALFWHGHFTSKYFDVLAPRLMYDQLQTLQRHGSRNFASLLKAVVRDPAMQIFLDNAFNTRERPNENLARELLELFTMGVGHYSEDDVKALARMLAGHGVDFAGDWRYRVQADGLDLAPKRFLGQGGVRTLADAERAILAHPRTAEFIAGRFYREFVSLDDDTATVQALATTLRRHGYALRPMLRQMLLSDAFWSPAQRGMLVKTPVELLVGFVRTTGLPLADLGLLAEDTRLMGQELFEPPTVKGWASGMAWLNMATLRQREERLAAMWRCRQASAQALDAGNDLLLRFSAERDGTAPVRLRVLADGREVAAAQARCPAERPGAGQGSLKPVWELLRVPRAALPADARNVEVRFERGPGEHSTLFVNWVQLDGRRLPAHRGEQRFDAGQPCTGQEPPGMLYCPGGLRFSLAAAQVGEPTLEDRTHGRVNAVIESGTSRVPLQLRPAGRRPSIDVATWRGLLTPDALLPVPPMDASASRAADASAQLQAWLLDPAFNLK